MTVNRVLFDAQGPKARRRTRYTTVVAILAVAALIGLALKQFGENGQLAADRWLGWNHPSCFEVVARHQHAYAKDP